MKATGMFLSGMALAVLLALGTVFAMGKMTHPVSAAAPSKSGDEPQRTITVSGQASVTAVPDVAYITLSVQTRDKKAANALEDNNKRVAQVYQTLARFGVEKKDIQTTSLSLYQQEERDREGKVIARYYQANNTVRVTVRDMDNLGKILDAVVQSGANRLQGIQFGISDRAALLEQARLEAVKQGKAQAAAIAAAAGAKLGEVQTISFQSVAQPVMRDEMMLEAAPKMAGEVPVSGGQMQVTATVHMVFDLQSP